MNLLLIGPPNAGKGTQAQLLTEHFGIPHLSTGNLLRENIEQGTDLGKLAKSYVDSGQLVPDDLVINLVEKAIESIDLTKGVLFDGYPRNIAQAENLDALMAKHHSQLDTVILIKVKKSLLIERAIGRRVCTGCGATYHVKTHIPKVPGLCDLCGSPLVHRRDDAEEVVENRVKVYKEQTKPLVDYYKQTGRLLKVRGEGTKEKVFGDIISLLGNNA